MQTFEIEIPFDSGVEDNEMLIGHRQEMMGFMDHDSFRASIMALLDNYSMLFDENPNQEDITTLTKCFVRILMHGCDSAVLTIGETHDLLISTIDFCRKEIRSHVEKKNSDVDVEVVLVYIIGQMLFEAFHITANCDRKLKIAQEMTEYGDMSNDRTLN